MKPFNLEDAKKMSRMEVMTLVCEGLAEVTTKLAESSESAYQQNQFLKQARDFEALGKIFRADIPKRMKP